MIELFFSFFKRCCAVNAIILFVDVIKIDDDELDHE